MKLKILNKNNLINPELPLDSKYAVSNLKEFEIVEGSVYKKNYNEELTDEIFADMPVEEIAQTLLNYATVSSIEDISNLFIKNMMMGGMEEDE